ncbi:MAG TPA: 23S rRNA (pseudouridine(1915)-N(3))-methyltransferase RlmH [Polyangia bacterium]|nr:23S rRNA (pseudouridine(1915)-N(3))-methyltransferase RlmH [Polyangia bacterium]
MRFVIASVGRERADPAASLVADYLARIRKRFPIEEAVQRDDRRLAARLADDRQRGHRIVALDEHGPQHDSPAFAALLQSWMNAGRRGVTFAIGGADGLPAELLAAVDESLGLSRMTLPHRLARLVLAEQIYRALEILGGSPYHK